MYRTLAFGKHFPSYKNILCQIGSLMSAPHMTVIYEARSKEHRDINEMGLSIGLIGLQPCAEVPIIPGFFSTFTTLSLLIEQASLSDCFSQWTSCSS